MKEMFGIFDEVLKELINRRNELKELRLAMPNIWRKRYWWMDDRKEEDPIPKFCSG